MSSVKFILQFCLEASCFGDNLLWKVSAPSVLEFDVIIN